MLHRLLENIGDLAVYALTAFLFGIIKILVAPQAIPLKHSILTLVLGVLVGSLAGAVALELGSGDYVSITVSAIFSLLSRDIILAFLNRTLVSDLAKRAGENLVDKLTK